MLKKSDVSVAEAIKFFSGFGAEAGYFVPTDTGLSKSILDAHGSLRSFFLGKRIHDFEKQNKGPDFKVLRDAFIISEDKLVKTNISFYRPETKSGDPRFWIYKLSDYFSSFNLGAIFQINDAIYILNLSRIKSFDIKDAANSFLGEIFRQTEQSTDTPVVLLLQKMRNISKLGYVDTKRTGDTGVGMTLETLLGINANSSRVPDFMGIEIKAQRLKNTKKGFAKSSNRVNLFSQVPDWDISKCKSGGDILKKFGYLDVIKNKFQLYCTSSANPNPQGLFLSIDEVANTLDSKCNKSEEIEDVARWRIDNLQQQLEKKHSQTFWVKAKSKISSEGIEQFHYVQVEQTKNPFIHNFGTLVEIGAITMDYTLSTKSDGGTRDHGYLFKIHPSNFDLLFPAPTIYNLEE
jgi:hypothetical protein